MTKSKKKAPQKDGWNITRKNDQAGYNHLFLGHSQNGPGESPMKEYEASEGKGWVCQERSCSRSTEDDHARHFPLAGTLNKEQNPQKRRREHSARWLP